MGLITHYEKDKVEHRNVIKPGSFSIKTATLSRVKNTTGVQSIDIATKILGIVIYEDLVNPYLTGQLKIVDTENIPSKLPVIGGEKIILVLEDCFGDEREYSFYVTKIADRSKVSISASSYTIHFASDLYIRSALEKISKSYINQRGHQIISDLLQSDINYYDSDNNICCVIPNWRSIHAAKWVSSRTLSETYKESPYALFEDSNQDIYHVPLDMLYDETTNVTLKKLFNSWQRTTDDGNPSLLSDERMFEHQYSFLQGPEIVKTSDIIENALNGMYSNVTQEIDVFARDTVSKDYQYKRDFNSSKHLADKPFDMDRFDSPPLSRWRTSISSDGLFSQENHMDKMENFVASHESKLQQTENLVIRGLLPGSFSIRVGQKYFVDIPRFGDASTDDKGLQTIDEKLSGSFIIESIKHEYNVINGDYACVAQLFRDGLNS